MMETKTERPQYRCEVCDLLESSLTHSAGMCFCARSGSGCHCRFTKLVEPDATVHQVAAGFIRKKCSVCGEGLGFSENDPCDRHDDLPPPDQHVAPPKVKLSYDPRYGYVVSPPAGYSLEKFSNIEYRLIAPIQAALEKCETASYSINMNEILVNKSDWDALVALVKGEK